MKHQAIFRALPIAALCACNVAFAAEPTSPNSYTFSGTLDMGGTWKAQAQVTLPSGDWSGATAEFAVYERFA